MSMTLIDIIAERARIDRGEDPNPGVCVRCGKEKLTRDPDMVCATCRLREFLGRQGKN